MCVRSCPPNESPLSANLSSRRTQGPLPCTAIKLDWGRVSVDSAERLIGEVYHTPGRFLSFRQCHARIQDKWPVPGQYVCVEWLPPNVNKPECDPDQLRELALLGFRHPAIGLEPDLPLEILATGGPTLEADLERMLDEDGVGPPCGASDVLLADAEDDWSELV